MTNVSKTEHSVEKRRAARPRAALTVCLLFGCLWACRTNWAPITETPTDALQWPYAPNVAKITYARSLTGLARRRDPGRILASIAFGNTDDAHNTFLLPVAVATGADGRIAVADLGRKCVHLFIPGQERYMQLTGSNREKLASPVGVTFDERSRLYVTDSIGRVFAFEQDGTLLFVIKQAGARRLLRPTGITYSPRKQAIYVVDTLAHTVYSFTTRGTFLFSFGARGAGAGTFNFPTHITCTASGEIYVTDSLNFRIAIFDEDGRPRGGFGRHGDGSGDFAMPKGIAVDSDGAVYVVDALFDNVQLFDRKGEFLLTLGGRGTDFGEFWLPSGAFISNRNELYVCDTYNHRVQVFRIASRHADAPS